MNWEVSSMPFKTLSFNPTLFKKNLGRSWPLWGGVTAVGALVPLYMLLAVMSGEKIYLEQADFVSFLYNAAAFFLPAFTICYALLVAMFVWSYLHNSRSVGMMHALPVSRDTLFVTNTLSGLAMLLIPYVVVGGFLSVFALCYGAMDVGAVLITIAAVLLENLTFFGLATFCTMITGNIFAVAGYYLVLNFLAPALDLLVNSLAQVFIFGLTSEVSEFSLYFAPVAGLYNHVDVVYPVESNVSQPAALEGVWLIALYGLVGVLLLAAAWAFYRARRSESAGDIVAFRALRPVFRFGVSVLSALTLGRLAYEIFWATLFAEGDYADLVPMLVCMALTAIVGYYAASMLLDKTLRVFKGSLRGVAVVCAATVALGVAVSLDILGLERRVPDVEDVQSVSVWGSVDIDYRAGEDDTILCEKVIEAHRAIIAEKDYIQNFDNEFVWSEDTAWTNIRFEYRMKDGSSLYRSYLFPVTQSRMVQSGTYDAVLKSIVDDPAILLATVKVPAGAEFYGMMLEGRLSDVEEWECRDVAPADYEMVYAALLLDARESNFCMNSSFYYMWDKKLIQIADWEYFKNEPMFEIMYQYEKDGSRRNDSYYLNLQPGMKHTLKALVDCGVVTEEIIAGWNG